MNQEGVIASPWQQTLRQQLAAREKVKITTIVFAEGSWTMEEINERALYGKTFGTSQGTIRWDKAADGLGCDGFYAEGITALGTDLVAEVAELAHLCPSGAVQYEPLDGSPGERAPLVNTLQVRENGPVALHAPLTPHGPSLHRWTGSPPAPA